jgi:tRNA pseudouridine32 synthase / 23S rRNA pseudouridine746 synthase
MNAAKDAFEWFNLRQSCVVYEDEAILALNKPPGISVVGDSSGIDIVTLAKVQNEKLTPVHRIDKETSGLVILAKNPQVHAQLTRQFNKQTVSKTYLAIVSSSTIPAEGIIDLPLSQGRKNKVRVATLRENILYDEKFHKWYVGQEKILKTRIYPSLTKFKVTKRDLSWSLLSINPVTGRHHQIRVHLAWIGYPILGDPLFDNSRVEKRTYLHSLALEFDAVWKGDKRMRLEAPVDKEFLKPLKTS